MKHLVVAGALLVHALSTPAHAFSDPEGPHGGIVIKDGMCFMYYPVARVPGDIEDYFIDFLETADFQAVVTPSGNAKVTCRADMPENYDLDTALTAKDFFCFGVGFVSFDGVRVTSTPGGKISYSCHVNGANEGIVFVEAP